MTRAVPEWIGKTPDSRPPMRVRLRVADRDGWICHWSGRPVRPGDNWDADHFTAIINGGENRESNLRLILRGKPHKEKTAQDVAIKKITYRKRVKTYGTRESKSKWPKRKLESRPFPRRWKYADET